jgi:hypothetical protein
MKSALILAIAGLSAFHPAAAQSLFGTILGTVTDTSQSVVPKAQVRIRNIDTNAERMVTTEPVCGRTNRLRLRSRCHDAIYWSGENDTEKSRHTSSGLPGVSKRRHEIHMQTSNGQKYEL